MLNAKKLKGKIVENDLNVSTLAAQIGMDPATFYRRLNGESSFTLAEVDRIVKVLSLSVSDAVSIFFTEDVADMRLKECEP